MMIVGMFGCVAAVIVAGIFGAEHLIWVVGAMTPFTYGGATIMWQEWQDEHERRKRRDEYWRERWAREDAEQAAR